MHTPYISALSVRKLALLYGQIKIVDLLTQTLIHIGLNVFKLGSNLNFSLMTMISDNLIKRFDYSNSDTMYDIDR